MRLSIATTLHSSLCRYYHLQKMKGVNFWPTFSHYMSAKFRDVASEKILKVAFVFRNSTLNKISESWKVDAVKAILDLQFVDAKAQEEAEQAMRQAILEAEEAIFNILEVGDVAVRFDLSRLAHPWPG